MFTLETPRLILAATPLHVIKTRLRCDDFTADVPISIEREGQPRVEVRRVHFPPEWPGDAVALLPMWEKTLETDPDYEMWGGTMIDRAEMIAVGQMTLMPVPEQNGAVELGYGVNPAYQGRGYATEAARALVQWAERQPAIERITSACLAENSASVRALEKVGFRRIGSRMEEEGLTTLWEYPDLGRRVQSYLRWAVSRRETERIGPFLATFTPNSANPFLNYAIPDDGATPSSAQVAALAAAYARRGRKPRLEYLPAIAPAVEEALLAGGFTVEGRLPLMICAPGQERDLPVPPGIELVVPVRDEELLATAMAQHEAYGEAPAGPEDAERVRRNAAGGAIYVLARDAATEEPAGAGMCDTPHDGLTEIAGIGVRVPFRRRGIAGALAVRLAREAFAAGVTTPFLMAEAEAEERIYARAGFATRSEVLHISIGS